MGRDKIVDTGKPRAIWIPHPTRLPVDVEAAEDIRQHSRRVTEESRKAINHSMSVLQNSRTSGSKTGMRSAYSMMNRFDKDCIYVQESPRTPTTEPEGLPWDGITRIDQAISEMLLVSGALGICDSRGSLDEVIVTKLLKVKRLPAVLQNMEVPDPSGVYDHLKAYDAFGLFMKVFGWNHRPEFRPVARMFEMERFLPQ